MNIYLNFPSSRTKQDRQKIRQFFTFVRNSNLNKCIMKFEFNDEMLWLGNVRFMLSASMCSAEIHIKFYFWTCVCYSEGTTKINNNNTMKKIWKSFDNLTCHSSHAKLIRPNSSTVEIKINTQFPTLCWMTMCLYGISVSVYIAYIHLFIGTMWGVEHERTNTRDADNQIKYKHTKH